MARRRRIITPGRCYHVMLRGVEGRKIFYDDDDRVRMCLLLQYALEECDFRIHGFCFMSNHIHLLLQPMKGDLSAGMHRLAFRYAQHFNKRLNRKGYLFQGRYKAIAVEHGSYLRRVVRYIHLNPVRAGLVSHPAGYRWSSHQGYLRNAHHTWLTTDLVLSFFNHQLLDPVSYFAQFVELDDANAKEELREIRKSVANGVYGGEVFVEEYQKALAAGNNTQDDILSKRQDEAVAVDLELAIETLEQMLKVNTAELRSDSRVQALVDARAVFVRVLKQLNLMDTKALTETIARDRTCIERLAKRAQNTPKLTFQSEEIIRTLQMLGGMR